MSIVTGSRPLDQHDSKMTGKNLCVLFEISGDQEILYFLEDSEDKKKALKLLELFSEY